MAHALYLAAGYAAKHVSRQDALGAIQMNVRNVRCSTAMP